MAQHIGPRTVSGTGGSIKRVGLYRIHTFPSELVTDGLVLNLDAGNSRSYPSSGTTWIDLSGNGNNGTLTNGPSYSDADGGSIVFDGSNDYATFGNQSSLNFGRNNFNISCWIKTSATNAEYSSVVSKYKNSTNQGPWILLSNNSSKNVVFGIDGSNFLTSSTSVNNNVWRHISCQRTGLTNLQIYVDGVLVASKDNALNTDCTQTENLIIGAMNLSSLERWFDGNISSVQIYNRDLSAAEIAQNYDALKVRYTSYTNTFTPICAGNDGKVEVLCVAGGGGGGGGDVGSGGGAGGLIYNSAFSINSNSAVSLNVGKGGRGSASSTSQGNDGDNTTFGSLTAIGGGGGNGWGQTNQGNAGRSGGSGGGGRPGGAGTAGQGFAGGTDNSLASPNYPQGGGGGAGGVGQDAYQISGDGTEVAGDGGLGLKYAISGESKFYAGGGGGGIESGQNSGRPYGKGGSGVGGDGGRQIPRKYATNGIPNTGSGGGGDDPGRGGHGANGTVIVRYPAADYNVEVLVVGAGGGGGYDTGGGGGAGGLVYNSKYFVSAGENIQVIVGKGGKAAANSTSYGTNGEDSKFHSIVCIGGGAGGSNGGGKQPGLSGGSGGGGGAYSAVQGSGGSGVPGQGNDGGTAVVSAGGGGGGAGQAGFSGDGSINGNNASDGGDGLSYSITGSSVVYAAGGGGGQNANTDRGVGGSSGVGGTGGTSSRNPTEPSAGTGSGGGGGANVNQPNGTRKGTGGANGVVIIAYKGPQRGTGGTIDTTSRPGYTLHKFTSVGPHIFIP